MINMSQAVQLKDAADHLTRISDMASTPTITYRWRNTAGTSMHLHVGVDEFGVINSMIINVGSSGTTVHNIVNSLGRVISIALQKSDKDTALKIVQTLEGMTSDVVWMSEEMGQAASIPEVISKIILRHLDIETHIENTHTGDEEDGQD